MMLLSSLLQKKNTFAPLSPNYFGFCIGINEKPTIIRWYFILQICFYLNRIVRKCYAKISATTYFQGRTVIFWQGNNFAYFTNSTLHKANELFSVLLTSLSRIYDIIYEFISKYTRNISINNIFLHIYNIIYSALCNRIVLLTVLFQINKFPFNITFEIEKFSEPIV